MNWQLLFLKSNFVSCLPNRPKKAQRTCFPSTLPLLFHQRPIPPRKRLLNRGWQHPLHPEHWEKQHPKSSCLITMEKNVINWFFMPLTSQPSTHAPPHQSLTLSLKSAWDNHLFPNLKGFSPHLKGLEWRTIE